MNMISAISPPPPTIAWTDRLLVGNDDIDADHRRLFAIAERLHAGIVLGQGEDVVREVLHELRTYTLEHFSREEALMAQIRHAGMDEHVIEHRLLTYRLRNLHYQFEGGERDLHEPLAIFMERWLSRHILTADLELATDARAAAARS